MVGGVASATVRGSMSVGYGSGKATYTGAVSSVGDVSGGGGNDGGSVSDSTEGASSSTSSLGLVGCRCLCG